MDLFDLATTRRLQTDQSKPDFQPSEVYNKSSDETDHNVATDTPSEGANPWTGAVFDVWGPKTTKSNSVADTDQNVSATDKSNSSTDQSDAPMVAPVDAPAEPPPDKVATPPAQTFDATPPPTVTQQKYVNPLQFAKDANSTKKPSTLGDTTTPNSTGLTKTAPKDAGTSATDSKPTGIDLEKSLQWLEKAVQISDRTDTKSAQKRVSEGHATSINLIETLTKPGLTADRRIVLSEIQSHLNAEKWQEYTKYLDPALARAELALAKIATCDEKKIAEGEKGLIEAVSLRPELQIDSGFQRKVLSTYQQMEAARKNQGLPAWTGELKPSTNRGTARATNKDAAKKADEHLSNANEAYGEKGVKASLPHFEAAIKAADETPQDKVRTELTELFCQRLTVERSIVAADVREEDVDKLLKERATARDNEWEKYREYLMPGSIRVNAGLAMISSGEPELLARGKAMLADAVSKRPELEFSADYQKHLKQAFVSHYENLPTGKSTDAGECQDEIVPILPGGDRKPGGNPGMPGLAPQKPGDIKPRLADVAGQPNEGDDKLTSTKNSFEIGYKKFETRDLGKAAESLEDDKAVESYLSDSITGPVLTAAVLFLGYKITKGRIEAARARRAASAAASEAKSEGAPEVKTGETKPSDLETKPIEPKTGTTSDTVGSQKPGTAGDTNPATPKPDTMSDTAPVTQKPETSRDTTPATDKPGTASDLNAAKPKPAELPLPERINAATESLRPGLTKILEMGANGSNPNKHQQLVENLLSLDKAQKIDDGMKFYLENPKFLKNGGLKQLKDLVEKVVPKTEAPSRRATPARPPLTESEIKTATEGAFKAARADIEKYGQEQMVPKAKEYTNAILGKYLPGVEATEVFAGSEGLAVRLNDGSVLKFRPNTEWDSNWGTRKLDMPLMSIDGGDARPMTVGKDGWLVYRQPYGEAPQPKQVDTFLRQVRSMRGDTGDFGSAVDSAARQLGMYKNPNTGRMEVRSFDYSSLEMEYGEQYEFTEQDALNLDKNKPDTNTTRNTAPEGTKPDTTKAEGAKPETTKPETEKPGTAKVDAAKPDAAKPEGAKPVTAKPEGAKPAEAMRTTSGAVDELPIETSPFEKGAQAEPTVERPGAAMESAKMIEIKLPGGVVARMAKADAPAFLERVEKEFKTSDFGKVLDELIADKNTTEEQKRQYQEVKERFEKLPPELKEECKAEFFANIRSQLGLKTETTEVERARSSRVGRSLAIGGGALGVGILATAVLRNCLQREQSRSKDRIQVEFKSSAK